MSSTTIELKREFPFPVARVFRAWADPRDLERWAWGSLGVGVEAVADFRPGGAFRVSTRRPDGATWAFSGTYTGIDPERRLAHTLHWDAPMGYVSTEERVTVLFAPWGGATHVTFLHEGVPDAGSREEHARGWADVLDCLERYLEAERSRQEQG